MGFYGNVFQTNSPVMMEAVWQSTKDAIWLLIAGLIIKKLIFEVAFLMFWPVGKLSI